MLQLLLELPEPLVPLVEGLTEAESRSFPPTLRPASTDKPGLALADTPALAEIRFDPVESALPEREVETLVADVPVVKLAAVPPPVAAKVVSVARFTAVPPGWLLPVEVDALPPELLPAGLLDEVVVLPAWASLPSVEPLTVPLAGTGPAGMLLAGS